MRRNQRIKIKNKEMIERKRIIILKNTIKYNSPDHRLSLKIRQLEKYTI